MKRRLPLKKKKNARKTEILSISDENVHIVIATTQIGCHKITTWSQIVFQDLFKFKFEIRDICIQQWTNPI